MRALAVLKPGITEIVDIPAPEISEFECLVRVRACGFCNCSDIEIINNNHVNIDFAYPIILGHEGAGEIMEIGARVKNYHVGDRIVFPEGRTQQGGYKPFAGHYCEYAVVRDLAAMAEAGMDVKAMVDENILCSFPRVFPKEISFEDAAVLVPARETFSAVRNIGVTEGSKVLIYGDGPNGFALCAFSRIFGASWIGVAGHHANRLKHIKEKGNADVIIDSSATDVGKAVKDVGLDIVIDAVGRMEILVSGSHMINAGGKVVLYSGVHKEHSLLDMYAWANNVTFHKHFFPCGDLDAHDEVIRLILDGGVNLKDFYSHLVPLDEFQRAIDITNTREAFKAVVAI